MKESPLNYLHPNWVGGVTYTTGVDPEAGKRPEPEKVSKPEAVNHPQHYNTHPSGVECIDVVEHMGFNLGNAIKYIWRCDHKGKHDEDLEKAIWYIKREIERRKK